ISCAAYCHSKRIGTQPLRIDLRSTGNPNRVQLLDQQFVSDASGRIDVQEILRSEYQLGVPNFRGQFRKEAVVGRDRQTLDVALLDNELAAAAQLHSSKVFHAAGFANDI